MSYCCIVRDNSWRSSTFHFIFQDGCAYLDVKVGNPVTGDEALLTNCSFDGAGCLSDTNIPMPAGLASELLQLVPNEKDSYEVPEDSELAKKIKSFFVQNMDKVKEDWREDFASNGVVDEEDLPK